MSIFSRFNKPSKPTLKEDDFPDYLKVALYGQWYIENDPVVGMVNSPTCNLLFDHGIRPSSGASTNPEDTDFFIVNLTKWFFVFVYLNLNYLLSDKDLDLPTMINVLEETVRDKEDSISELSKKFNLDPFRDDFPKELENTPNDLFGVNLKTSYLSLVILKAEVRILRSLI